MCFTVSVQLTQRVQLSSGGDIMLLIHVAVVHIILKGEPKPQRLTLGLCQVTRSLGSCYCMRSFLLANVVTRSPAD